MSQNDAKERQVVLNGYIPLKMKIRLEDHAEKVGESQAVIMRLALRQYLDRADCQAAAIAAGDMAGLSQQA